MQITHTDSMIRFENSDKKIGNLIWCFLTQQYEQVKALDNKMPRNSNQGRIKINM